MDAATEPLIYGAHHFIQYCAGEDEPWCVMRLDFMGDAFFVATKEQAVELMKKADAYRDMIR